MRQALAGMLWSKQCYYFDVDLWLRERRLHPLRAPAPAGDPQRVVVPHVQPRRHLDAGQVGVPVVRRVGPGVPLHPARDGRPGLREEPDRPDAVPGLPASERPDPRLRVELRRRQPARARLRGALPAERWRQTSARWTSRSSGRLRAAAAEFHLVGEPQGSRPVATCSRAASSAWTTSACSTAAPLCPPAGGLEQADGTAWMAMFSQNMLELALALLPHDPALRGLHPQVRRALLLDRRRRGPDRRASRRDVGRGGRLLLRRAPPARRQRLADQGALAGRPPPALRHHRDPG